VRYILSVKIINKVLKPQSKDGTPDTYSVSDLSAASSQSCLNCYFPFHEGYRYGCCAIGTLHHATLLIAFNAS